MTFWSDFGAAAKKVAARAKPKPKPAPKPAKPAPKPAPKPAKPAPKPAAPKKVAPKAPQPKKVPVMATQVTPSGMPVLRKGMNPKNSTPEQVEAIKKLQDALKMNTDILAVKPRLPFVPFKRRKGLRRKIRTESLVT